MEPMNAFLTTHRQEFKAFVDSICAISSDRATSAIPPSYATPITILSRLPATSREGFPSLPYLIDQAREFAALVSLWVDGMGERRIDPTASDELKTFDRLCEDLRLRTRDCLNQAEQAERPSGILEVKWEELIEQMDRKARITSFPNEEPTPSPTASIHQIRKQQGRRRLTESSTSTSSTNATNQSELKLPYANPTSTQSRTQISRPAVRHTTNGRAYPPTYGSTTRSSSETQPEDLTPPGSSSGVWDPGTDNSRGSDRESAAFPSHALHWNDNEAEGSGEAIGSLEASESSVQSLEAEVEGLRQDSAWNGVGIASRSPVSPGAAGSAPGAGRRLVDVWGFRKRGAGSGTVSAREGAGGGARRHR
jgi:hypothetical protein